MSSSNINKTENHHVFFGNNFESCEDKILLVQCGLNIDRIDNDLEKTKAKKNIDLNKNDIAVYGYVYNYEKKKKELKVKTDSDLIKLIKPKPYNKKLWEFICSKKISTIYFLGSFDKAIGKRIEYNKRKIPLKTLLDEKGINCVTINLGRETSVSEIKDEIKKFLLELKYDIDSSISDFSFVDFFFPNGYNFNEANYNKRRYIKEYQYNIFYQYYKEARENLKKVQQKIEEIPEIQNEINEEKEVRILAKILVQLAATECFIPVPMLLDVLKKTQENTLFSEKLFSQEMPLMHCGFPIPEYNHGFQENNKSIDFEKCDEEINRLYTKLKKLGYSNEILDIMTTRIYCENDIAKMKILCLPSSKLSSYLVKRKGLFFNIGHKFKFNLNQKYPPKKVTLNQVSFEDEYRTNFNFVKDKLYQIKDKKKDNWGMWCLKKKFLWKPSK